MTSSSAFPKLFLADQCPHSHQLWKAHSKQLSQCPTIYVFNRQDRNAKRRSETILAIKYNSIRQFPTLLFADGTRLTTKLQIERDLMESIEVLNDKPLIPRFQDAPENIPTQGPLDPQAQISLTDKTIQQSLIGDWPSADDGQISQQQQRMPNYFQQNEPQMNQYNNKYAPQQQPQQLPYQQQQAQPQQSQIRPMNATNTTGLPEDGQNGQRIGIGASSDVDTSAAGAGSSTSMAFTNNATNDEDFEYIGDWPTSRKVNGLTGRGNQNIDTFLSTKSAQNNNMQNMRMNLGQVVAEPVPY